MKRIPAKRKPRARAIRRVILVTGFEPFGAVRVNPSQEIARQLHGLELGRGHRVVAGLLPCVFGEARRELRRLQNLHRPEIVICLGLAEGRSEVTPERVAINVDDARIADNAGDQPIDRPVVRGGPVAYWSTLPIKAIVAALQARRIPTGVSQSAGTFVCNHVFYGLMHSLAQGRSSGTLRAGFIHVPSIREESGSGPGLPLETLVEAIRIAIETTVTVRRDLRKGSGQVS